jgi:hypothetical protein
LYYSIWNATNANSAWVKANNYCPVELVIVGTFPDSRYFSVTDYDMHYANTQHLADAELDPAERPNGTNNEIATNPRVRSRSGLPDT